MLWNCRSPVSVGASVQEQNGTVAPCEVLLQRENLAAVSQRVAREQSHFGQGVENDASGLRFLYQVHQFGNCLIELYLSGMEEGVQLRLHRFPRGGELVHGDAFQIPIVRAGHRAKLVFGFRERDVQSAFALVHSVEEELEPQRGLPNAGATLQEVKACSREPSGKYAVESCDAGAHQVRWGRWHFVSLTARFSIHAFSAGPSHSVGSNHPYLANGRAPREAPKWGDAREAPREATGAASSAFSVERHRHIRCRDRDSSVQRSPALEALHQRGGLGGVDA